MHSVALPTEKGQCSSFGRGEIWRHARRRRQLTPALSLSGIAANGARRQHEQRRRGG